MTHFAISPELEILAIDEDHVDSPYRILTITISIPSILPPVTCSSILKAAEEDLDLFSAEKLGGLVKFMQKVTQDFELHDALHFYGWRVAVKAISTCFHAGYADDCIKPIVELTSLSCNPNADQIMDTATQKKYFPRLIDCLLEGLNVYWQDKVNVTFAGSSKQVTGLSKSPSVSRTNSLFTFWEQKSITVNRY